MSRIIYLTVRIILITIFPIACSHVALAQIGVGDVCRGIGNPHIWFYPPCLESYSLDSTHVIQANDAIAYPSSGFIEVGNGFKIVSQARVELGAEQSITLLPGFTAEEGCVFHTHLRHGLCETSHNSVDQAMLSTVTPVEISPKVPTAFALESNYPNPFNPVTTITYSLPQEVMVTLTVHDLLGRPIKTLVHQIQKAGRHRVSWDSTSEKGWWMPNGIYFYNLSAGHFNQTRQMILLK